MPLDSEKAAKQWYRYAWVRDNGHTKFIEKSDLCERFFQGDQWTEEDKAILRLQRRPALTINKILSTVSNVLGEQIYNRSEISFRPRGKSPEETADILTKVFKYVSDNNQLDWKRSDMFADGIITSRGFLDMRMDFNESLQGDIAIELLNPKNVMVDPDAEQYDPDTWKEVFITKWLTPDDIAILYNEEDAERLRGRAESYFPYGYDSIDFYRERFGTQHMPQYFGGLHEGGGVARSVRVIERQYKKLDRQWHFVQPKTGETRPIPSSWEKEQIENVRREFGLRTIKKLVNRIRWTVTADNLVLHDDWSPYKHFTVIPYFPYFRRGASIGMVENLIDSQELLNKSSSQELHIANTTANSGYKVRAGSLVNMTSEELEARGAETGLVIEVNGDPDKDVVKIQPNVVPQALDRISFKAEDHIDKISGIGESAKGFDREDVAAKAIAQKKQSNQTNIAKPLDSLVRTDWLIARNALDLIQEYMTEERVLTITKDAVQGTTEQVTINQMSPTGQVLNDLMVGEYSIVISSVPQRETLEDSTFEQLATMRKDLGVQVPDSVLIKNSRVPNKSEIIKEMEAAANSQAAQEAAAIEKEGKLAVVDKTKAEAEAKRSDSQLRRMKAEAELAELQKGDPKAAELQFEAQRLAMEERHEQERMALEREAAMQKMALEREAAAQKAEIAMAESAQKAKINEQNARTERMAKMVAASQPQMKPQSNTVH